MTSTVPKQRYLPPKDAANFRLVLKLYEQRQYKKALKTTDLILKRFPEHGETLAMKGLILTFLDNKAEGHELIKLGLRNDLSSFICWHVYGLYYRSERNFEEAAKCYIHSLKYDPDNQNILRDLGLLQGQMRNWEGLITSRKAILRQKPSVRQNWTGLAVGYHMVKNYQQAEEILTKFENTLTTSPPKENAERFEHSELLLYKNKIIYESGDVKHALEDLDLSEDNVFDKLAVLEYRALYNLELGNSAEAVKEYRKLLNRNPDNKDYYFGLEKALGVTNDLDKRKELYLALSKQYKYSDVAKSIPLGFLTGDDFKFAVRNYLTGYLSRGVPSAFVNVKPLYSDEAKTKIIDEVVLEYLDTITPATNGVSNGTTNGVKNETPTTWLWVVYYLAQHYSKLDKADIALEYIEKAIAHTPTLVELHMTKAKILKRKGDLIAASDSMNAARELDLQDRFVNTKAAKYYLRANRNEEAIAVISLFTKNDTHPNGVPDLHEMQAFWFLNEQGDYFARVGKPGLALKRYHSVKKIFDDWWGDQFDFHQYCTRRGTMRSYVDLLRWEDTLYSNPYYIKAAESAIKVYLSLVDEPKAPKSAAVSLEGLSEEEKKKALKKLKRERAKENKKTAKENATEDAKDDDPLGRKFENSPNLLEDALAFWTPIANNPEKVDFTNWGEEIEKRKSKADEKIKESANSTSV
ncbi:NMDA receptor-regulated protein 1-domain-containing protein [Lipomyces japonicus]|uniref:NMDA receptor-regulated protein 1-domain-containing protein n=1 Tax=Lipomyces japonicus TaxID=56871 RepID=UPI0034CEE134